MRFPPILVLAALSGVAAFGLYVTEPDVPSGQAAPLEEATAAVSPDGGGGADSDQTDSTPQNQPDPTSRRIETADVEPLKPLPEADKPEAVPVETATTVSDDAVRAAERPPQTCGLVAREDAVGAVVFRAGPESLVVTAADLIQSSPLAMTEQEWGVSIELCPESAQEMAAFTERRIGQQLQIISSGALLSAPILRTAIRDGRLTLTGGFDRVQAEQIADRIAGRSG